MSYVPATSDHGAGCATRCVVRVAVSSVTLEMLASVNSVTEISLAAVYVQIWLSLIGRVAPEHLLVSKFPESEKTDDGTGSVNNILM